MKFRNNAALFLVLLLALISLSRNSLAWGQTAATGQIVGTVTDPSKATVGQAAITVTNEATGISRTVKSNADGDYVVPLLTPGSYSVTVEATGFKTQTTENILVQVASTATVNIRLQLGGSAEKVVVEASAEILQTDSSANGGTVNDKTDRKSVV